MTGVAFNACVAPTGDMRLNGIELQQHERGLLVVGLWYEWWHSGLRNFLWFRGHAPMNRPQAEIVSGSGAGSLVPILHSPPICYSL